jgi:phosphoglycolate phosphatase
MALFLFDIDGTILKGRTQEHHDAFARAFQGIYGQPLDLNGVLPAGRTDMWLLAEPLRRRGLSNREISDKMPQAFALMEEYVDRHLGDVRVRLLPGIPEVVHALHERGELLGLLTGNLSGIAFAKMRHAGLGSYFETGGFGQESEVRDHLVPVAIRHASDRAGHPIAPSETVVIGDTPLDIEAGRAGGTRTVGVATGPFTQDQLREAGADLVFPSFEDWKRAVKELLALANVSTKP